MLKLKQLLCSIMLLFCLCSYQGVWAQESGRVSIPAGQITLQNLIRQIEKQTDYSFVFDSSINMEQTLTLKSTSGKDVQTVLKQALSQSGITFKVAGSQIILKGAATGKEKKDISGVITDENGEPVIGATVRLKGSGSGTITNMDGQFALTASAGEELEISYVGCITQNIKIGDNNSFKVVLKEDAQNLEEVVVVGYGGTQKKKDLTSAIATIGGKELSNQTVSNAVAAMQGRLSGVQVTNSGSPGSSPSIRIRGTGSIYIANPIYVVDGMIVDDISYLGPNDIESMSVLKDASASAIYGVRAANGVIMVTTKRGAKEGKIKVDFNAYVGVKTPSHVHELINGPEYVTLYNEYMEMTDNPQAVIDPNNFTTSTNWFDEVLTSTFTCNEDITIRDGNDRSTFSVGVNHLKEDGLVKNDNYERLGLRANYDFKISKSITTGLNFVVSSIKANPAPGSLLSGIYRTSPLLPTREQNGGEFGNPENVNGFDTQGNNPEVTLYYNHQWRNNIKAVINGFIDIKFLKNFTLRSTLGFNPSYGTSVNYQPKYEISSKLKHATNDLSKSSSNNMALSWDNTLTYEKTFAQDHSLKVMVGYSYRETTTNSLTGSAEDIIDIPEINQSYLFLTIGKGANYTMKVSDSGSKIVQIGYLGRINYDYKHRYLLNATLRADASSKFPANNRRGIFPSVGLGWVISEEPFMQGSGIDFMKLRAGWGLLGNDNIPSNLYQLSTSNGTSIIFGPEQNSGTGSGVSSAVTVNKQYNPDLRWEVVNETNIGLDMNFFSNRLSTSLDWYYKLTQDAIFATTALGSSGLSSSGVWGNFADILNTGFEVSASWSDRIGEFSYNIGANFTFNKNEVLELAENQSTLLTSATFDKDYNSQPSYIAKVGYPMGLMYGYIYEGTYKYDDFTQSGNSYTLKANVPHYTSESNTQPGMPKYKDINGDGIIDTNDRTIIGRGLPIHTGGFTNSFEYKGFDLSVFFQWSYGNDILNANRLFFESSNNKSRELNQYASYADRWTPDNPDSDIPAATTSASNKLFSSRVIEDGSFLRLKTVTLGYTFPTKLIAKAKLSSARVYLAAQNLWTWTSYSGYDPEVSIRNSALTPGLDFSSYPRAYSVSFGVSLGF